jgi:hypothetical protein
MKGALAELRSCVGDAFHITAVDGYQLVPK